MVLRKLVVAGTLIGLMILAVSLFTAPASSAASSKALRYKIVCRRASYEVVKRHHQRLVVRHRARFVTVYAVRRYRIVKRARTFVVLRKLSCGAVGFLFGRNHRRPRLGGPAVRSQLCEWR